MLKKLSYIFDRNAKITIMGLLLLIIIGSFFEMLGVTVFMPFIELIMNSESLQTNELLIRLFSAFSCIYFRRMYIYFSSNNYIFLYYKEHLFDIYAKLYS